MSRKPPGEVLYLALACNRHGRNDDGAPTCSSRLATKKSSTGHTLDESRAFSSGATGLYRRTKTSFEQCSGDSDIRPAFSNTGFDVSNAVSDLDIEIE